MQWDGKSGRAPWLKFTRRAFLAVLVLALLLAGGPTARAGDPVGLPSGSIDIAELAFYRAVDLNAAGSPNQAVKLLRLAVETRPDIALYHEALGDTYLALGEADLAVLAMEQYETALGLEPGRTRAREGLIQAATVAGRLDVALDTLEALAFGDGFNPQYLTDLVAFYIVADETERGIATLDRSSPPPEARAIVQLCLAALHRYEGNLERAVALAAQAEADTAAPEDVRGLARELAAAWTDELAAEQRRSP